MGLDGKNPALQTPNNCCPLTVLLKKNKYTQFSQRINKKYTQSYYYICFKYKTEPFKIKTIIPLFNLQ